LASASFISSQNRPVSRHARPDPEACEIGLPLADALPRQSLPAGAPAVYHRRSALGPDFPKVSSLERHGSRIPLGLGFERASWRGDFREVTAQTRRCDGRTSGKSTSQWSTTGVAEWTSRKSDLAGFAGPRSSAWGCEQGPASLAQLQGRDFLGQPEGSGMATATATACS
jgi:hypothetical protein